MLSEVLGPVEALKEGWRAFAKRPVFAFASAVVWLVLGIMGWSVWMDWGRGLNYSAVYALTYALPIVIYVLVAFPIIGGVMTSLLTAARGLRPTFGDYLAAIKGFIKWWRMGARAMAMTAAFYVLIGIVYSLMGHGPAVEGMTFLRLFWTVVGALTLALTLSTRWPFGWFALAEADSPPQALKTFAIAAKGRTLRAFLTTFVIVCWPSALLALGVLVYRTNANAFGVPGWIAFAVGVALLTAVALNSVAVVYVQLTPSAERDVAREKAA